MRALSFWLWLIAYGSGFYALALVWNHSFTATSRALFGVCLVTGLLGIMVDRVRAWLS